MLALGVPCCQQRRAVAAGPAAAGLLLTRGALQCSCLQLAVTLQLQQWLGLRMVAAGLAGWLAGLGGAFILVDCDLCRSQLVQGCRISPALPRTCCLDHKQTTASENLPKKETEVLMLLNQKSRKKPTSLTPPRQSYSKLHQRVFFYGLSFTWFCNRARMTKAFNTQQAITAVKFPLPDLPR